MILTITVIIHEDGTSGFNSRSSCWEVSKDLGKRTREIDINSQSFINFVMKGKTTKDIVAVSHMITPN